MELLLLLLFFSDFHLLISSVFCSVHAINICMDLLTCSPTLFFCVSLNTFVVCICDTVRRFVIKLFGPLIFALTHKLTTYIVFIIIICCCYCYCFFFVGRLRCCCLFLFCLIDFIIGGGKKIATQTEIESTDGDRERLIYQVSS